MRRVVQAAALAAVHLEPHECSAAIRAPPEQRDRQALSEIHLRCRPTCIHSLTAARPRLKRRRPVRSIACGWARENHRRMMVARRSLMTALGPLGRAAELRRQARNLAQLLGHFLKTFRGLL